jgi:transposase-like protein
MMKKDYPECPKCKSTAYVKTYGYARDRFMGELERGFKCTKCDILFKVKPVKRRGRKT